LGGGRTRKTVFLLRHDLEGLAQLVPDLAAVELVLLDPPRADAAEGVYELVNQSAVLGVDERIL
jgi:hypothetical protein